MPFPETPYFPLGTNYGGSLWATQSKISRMFFPQSWQLCCHHIYILSHKALVMFLASGSWPASALIRGIDGWPP